VSQRAAFDEAVPGGYFLDQADLAGLTECLRHLSWIGSAESVRELSPAGAGNMNCTLRVTTDTGGSFVLKQSRPWVEKYPQIPAPVDRALQEGAFYEIVASQTGVAAMMPRLMGIDRRSRMLMLEDLGPAGDYTWMYGGTSIESRDFDQLVRYLSVLHSSFLDSPRSPKFVNRAMRSLNHQHIFQIPLSENGPDLDAITPGLQSAADALRSDQDFVAEVASLGENYLADGRALLHGDFFPGSWVRAGGAIRVIDPEFSFFGPPEFDVGVMLAHLFLAGQPTGIASRLFDVYQASDRGDRFDHDLAARFAGVEMMRRLVGVAQLPLTATMQKKQDWLAQARFLVTTTNPWRSL
jgi:5-methylthioribose kinase